jgi:homogentisate 1,2-dioxygenase
MDSSSDLYSNLKYLNGLGNGLATEALPGAIPVGKSHSYVGQNSPVKLKYGLFPEQLTGTAFTVKRAENQKVWYYKLRPSAVEGQY